MSFIPVTKQRASFKDKGNARLTVRRTKSGASGLYVSVAVRGKKNSSSQSWTMMRKR